MIPNNESLAIMPDQILKKFDRYFQKKFEDLDCDQDQLRRKYNLYCFGNIKKDLLAMIKSKNFWINSLDLKHCDHVYKNGSKKGTFCNRSIDISYEKHRTKDNGSYKCYKHVSKTVYKSTKRKDISRDLFCISLNNKNKLCNNFKLYGNYCNCHYSRSKEYMDNIKNNEHYYLYYDFNKELNYLFNINIFDEEKKILEKELSLKKEDQRPTMELLEFAPPKLNNSDSSGNIKDLSLNKEIKDDDVVGNNNNNKYEKISHISNNLNKNNLKHNYKDNYVKIEYKKCEQKECTNCKDYNIVYTSYCSEHIYNRPKPKIDVYYYLDNNLKPNINQRRNSNSLCNLS